jgi:hypothetical protein
VLGVEEIKKGLKSPCFRAPPRLAGGSSTPGGAPSYENNKPELPHDYEPFLPQFPAHLPSWCARYKHCGNAGQGKCGRSLASSASTGRQTRV